MELQIGCFVFNLGRSEEIEKREGNEGRLCMVFGEMIFKFSGLKSEQEKKKENLCIFFNGTNRQESDEEIDKRRNKIFKEIEIKSID